jgi:threonine synthase
MQALGFLRRLPRLLGVQAAGASPLVAAFDSGGDLVPAPARTIADSICVGHPRNWRKALRAVRESRGAFLAVPDEAILEAMRAAGQRAGLFGEPAGVAGLAGLRLAVEDGVVGRRETALGVVTGSGLKDARTAARAAGQPFDLPPDDEALAEHLRDRPLQ